MLSGDLERHPDPKFQSSSESKSEVSSGISRGSCVLHRSSKGRSEIQAFRERY